jgi:hypothetical protein
MTSKVRQKKLRKRRIARKLALRKRDVGIRSAVVQEKRNAET